MSSKFVLLYAHSIENINENNHIVRSGGEIYSSIMEMHFGLSALTLFWFQCSEKELEWILQIGPKTENYFKQTHTRMSIEIMFDCSTPDPILSSSDVFYCYAHCFIDFSVSLTSYLLLFLPSSYSNLYFCRCLGIHFKEKISNNALMLVWVCAWIWPAFCYCHSVYMYIRLYISALLSACNFWIFQIPNNENSSSNGCYLLWNLWLEFMSPYSMVDMHSIFRSERS